MHVRPHSDHFQNNLFPEAAQERACTIQPFSTRLLPKTIQNGEGKIDIYMFWLACLMISEVCVFISLLLIFFVSSWVCRSGFPFFFSGGGRCSHCPVRMHQLFCALPPLHRKLRPLGQQLGLRAGPQKGWMLNVPHPSSVLFPSFPSTKSAATRTLPGAQSKRRAGREGRSYRGYFPTRPVSLRELRAAVCPGPGQAPSGGPAALCGGQRCLQRA